MVETPLVASSRSLVRLIKTIIPSAVAGSSSVREAESIHSLVLKSGNASSEYVSSALISLYAALGSFFNARRVFDEIPHPGLVSWTAAVRAYSISDRPKEALQLFREMRPAGLTPDPMALATALSACRRLEDSALVETLHGFITKSGIEIDAFVSTEMIRSYADSKRWEAAHRMFDEMPVQSLVASNSLIHGYAKNGFVEAAHQLFEEMPGRDVVSWNTMISAFSQAGKCREALSLFRKMEDSLLRPNKLTMTIVFSACAALGALDTAMWIHAYVERNSMNLDGALDHCLIDMYAKCGSIEKAVQVFEKIPVRRDLYSWTSMICGFAMHGQANRALSLYSRMEVVGVQPDGVTIIGVLNACAHAGLVDVGCQCFRSMEEKYGLQPKIEHYGCMVDLLGRVGCLKEAYALVLEMPMNPNAVVWGTLLSACKVHKEVNLGEIAAAKLIELDPSDPWARVMLSNMYAEACDWSGVMRLRKAIKVDGMGKTPGCSSIEVNGLVHEFVAAGNLHPQHGKIQAMLEKFEAHMYASVEQFLT